MPKIDVLLATYNGEQFLPELLCSLGEQTFKDWRLIVRDDGSSDETLAFVEQWASRAAVPVRILESGRSNLGACGNFSALLEASDAPYFAPCDQDDVWLPEKLTLMLERLRTAETRAGEHKPLLAYSDLRVVDENLNEIHPSFRAFAPLLPPRLGRLVPDLMMQNVVTGCASLGNAALRQAALPIPPEAIMHDWWLALVAAATGELIDVPEATVLYRQHGANTIGAVRWTPVSAGLALLTDFARSAGMVRSFIVATQRQALTFHARFAGAIDNRSAETIERYALLGQRPTWERKKFFVENLAKRGRSLRTVALLTFI